MIIRTPEARIDDDGFAPLLAYEGMWAAGAAPVSLQGGSGVTGGTVASTEAMPLWGGLPVSAGLSNSPLGPPLGRAVAPPTVKGFALGASPLGIAGEVGMSWNYARLGSGIWLTVQRDDTIGWSTLPTSPVAWDFTNGCLTAATSPALPVLTLAIGMGHIVLIAEDGVVDWSDDVFPTAVIQL